MKHKFLLDENIVVLAVKGEDDRGNPDLTAADLVRSLARNCHRITMTAVIRQRYWRHLKALEEARIVPQHLSFLAQLIKNSEKAVYEYGELPELPPGVVIPPDDIDIVKSAMLSKVPIVTTDGPLKEAINAHPLLGLTVLSPSQALDLARST